MRLIATRTIAYLALGLTLAGAAFHILLLPQGVSEALAAGDDWRELGAQLYTLNCAPCHGLEGQGLPGVYPAFAGNAFVTGDPVTVARVPLNGRGGMPTFREVLSDVELAAILSYIRNSWGNEADPVTPELVAQVRHEQGAAGEHEEITN